MKVKKVKKKEDRYKVLDDIKELCEDIEGKVDFLILNNSDKLIAEKEYKSLKEKKEKRKNIREWIKFVGIGILIILYLIQYGYNKEVISLLSLLMGG